jgi:hypothetical protein
VQCMLLSRHADPRKAQHQLKCLLHDSGGCHTHSATAGWRMHAPQRRPVLQADHQEHKRETAQRTGELAANLAQGLEACRDKIGRDVAAVQDDVIVKCKAVESMCQVWLCMHAALRMSRRCMLRHARGFGWGF